MILSVNILGESGSARLVCITNEYAQWYQRYYEDLIKYTNIFVSSSNTTPLVNFLQNEIILKGLDGWDESVR